MQWGMASRHSWPAPVCSYSLFQQSLLPVLYIIMVININTYKSIRRANCVLVCPCVMFAQCAVGRQKSERVTFRDPLQFTNLHLAPLTRLKVQRQHFICASLLQASRFSYCKLFSASSLLFSLRMLQNKVYIAKPAARGPIAKWRLVGRPREIGSRSNRERLQTFFSMKYTALSKWSINKEMTILIRFGLIGRKQAPL